MPENQAVATAGTVKSADLEDFKGSYIQTIGLIERLYRVMLDVVKDEFERIGQSDINCIQAILLFNIGEEELSASDLKARRLYQGSNVSYNLKKLVEAGYLHYERCRLDRRSVRIRLTEKGAEIRDFVARVHERNAERLASEIANEPRDLDELNGQLETLERFWRAQIRYLY